MQRRVLALLPNDNNQSRLGETGAETGAKLGAKFLIRFDETIRASSGYIFSFCHHFLQVKN